MLPDDHVELPLKCAVPSCDAPCVRLVVRSASIVTLRCPACGFMWSIEIAALPPDVRRSLQIYLLDAALRYSA